MRAPLRRPEVARVAQAAQAAQAPPRRPEVTRVARAPLRRPETARVARVAQVAQVAQAPLRRPGAARVRPARRPPRRCTAKHFGSQIGRPLVDDDAAGPGHWYGCAAVGDEASFSPIRRDSDSVAVFCP